MSAGLQGLYINSRVLLKLPVPDGCLGHLSCRLIFRQLTVTAQPLLHVQEAMPGIGGDPAICGAACQRCLPDSELPGLFGSRLVSLATLE